MDTSSMIASARAAVESSFKFGDGGVLNTCEIATNLCELAEFLSDKSLTAADERALIELLRLVGRPIAEANPIIELLDCSEQIYRLAESKLSEQPSGRLFYDLITAARRDDVATFEELTDDPYAMGEMPYPLGPFVLASMRTPGRRVAEFILQDFFEGCGECLVRSIGGAPAADDDLRQWMYERAFVNCMKPTEFKGLWELMAGADKEFIEYLMRCPHGGAY